MCECLIKYALKNSIQRKQPTTSYLHTLKRRHERKAKSTQTNQRIHSRAHTHTHAATEKEVMSIRLFRSLTLSSLVSLTAFTFSKDNHHHSSNALEQLLGLCSVVFKSTTNNVWLVEKVEWNGATVSKKKRKSCSLHIRFTLTHSSKLKTCVCEDRENRTQYLHLTHTLLQTWHGVKFWSVIHTRAFDTRTMVLDLGFSCRSAIAWHWKTLRVLDVGTAVNDHIKSVNELIADVPWFALNRYYPQPRDRSDSGALPAMYACVCLTVCLRFQHTFTMSRGVEIMWMYTFWMDGV